MSNTLTLPSYRVRRACQEFLAIAYAKHNERLERILDKSYRKSLARIIFHRSKEDYRKKLLGNYNSYYYFAYYSKSHKIYSIENLRELAIVGSRNGQYVTIEQDDVLILKEYL